MIKIIKLLLTLLFIPTLSEAQKFGYVNSEFILKNMKEYSEAMNDIDLLSKAWEKEISDMYIEMEKKEISLKNEEILLTKDMYNERRGLLDKEWVSIREYQQKVFGFEGLYFLKKKELIEPIQDIIFESVEKIAKKNRLQIVFDKSSEPILLYTNPIHDYTDYVLEDLGLNKKNN
ncbi:MAG: OmpH family outer membrane protein [Bacteroidota bacterium]|uniref:Outer membrane chaperone Skp n=1 Tax=marine metagenome TaxID=408172 RepID=A0A381QQ86_9ZZZZ|nr:OmpH family outer membrane protein [Bacteroidota bacterium]|tara:strand:- start:391 stop:915 length:525 start_codon:yes stop_codon:yes gene_type:complete